MDSRDRVTVALKPERMAIFGGSFDPLHNAHLALARLALTALRLDKLLWVPAGQPWQKSRSVSAGEHRLAMLELATRDEPRFAVSRLELERPGPSYTVDTVRELKVRHPDVAWYLVIGQDQYASFQTWHDWQALLGLVTLAVANRPDVALAPSAALAGVAHEAVALPMMDISSTGIRERLAHGQGITDLVPDSVARYIAHHHLYQDPPPRS